jgi:hypothetical protein
MISINLRKKPKENENYRKKCKNSTKKEKNNIGGKYQTLYAKNYCLSAHLILVTTAKNNLKAY